MRTIAPLLLCASAALPGADLRLGIIGTDTSHVSVFSKAYNDAASAGHIPGAKVVIAYKGGSPDIESSASRVEGYAKELVDKYGVQIVPQISDMCGKVDGILLESVDGRKHLAQFKEAAKCGKPVFIDKPLAATYADAKEIARIAKASKVSWFSASSLRWAEILPPLRSPKNQTVTVWGPGPLESTHQLDLSWYAIHPIEMLFTVMGSGCVEVTRTVSTNDVITCKWKDGRLGTVNVLRPYGDYGAIAFREKEIVATPKYKHAYTNMLKELVQFFATGVPPVPNEETMEIFAFMDAAQRSKEAGGKPVRLR